MKHVPMLTLSLFMAMGISAQVAAQGQSQAQPKTQIQTQTQATEQVQERIYGSELMTPQERYEYQNRMREMKTDQEREAFRFEHHKQMKERAKAQGKSLPDTPPADGGPGRGGGMGPGGDMGYGSGKGAGPNR